MLDAIRSSKVHNRHRTAQGVTESSLFTQPNYIDVCMSLQATDTEYTAHAENTSTRSRVAMHETTEDRRGVVNSLDMSVL